MYQLSTLSGKSSAGFASFHFSSLLVHCSPELEHQSCCQGPSMSSCQARDGHGHSDLGPLLRFCAAGTGDLSRSLPPGVPVELVVQFGAGTRIFALPF